MRFCKIANLASVESGRRASRAEHNNNLLINLLIYLLKHAYNSLRNIFLWFLATAPFIFGTIIGCIILYFMWK